MPQQGIIVSYDEGRRRNLEELVRKFRPRKGHAVPIILRRRRVDTNAAGKCGKCRLCLLCHAPGRHHHDLNDGERMRRDLGVLRRGVPQRSDSRGAYEGFSERCLDCIAVRGL